VGLPERLVLKRLQKAGLKVSRPQSFVNLRSAQPVIKRLKREQARTASRREQMLRQLVRFLSDADIQAELRSDAVMTGDRPITTHGPAGSLSPDGFVDHVVWERYGDRLLDAVVGHLAGRNIPLKAVKGTHGVVLLSRVRKEAIVRPTHATLAVGKPIQGNFLADGAHWNALRRRLPKASVTRSASRAPSGTPPATRVLTRFPHPVPVEVEELADFASTLIRDDRTVTFGHVVEMRTEAETIRFMPVTNARGPVEAPFSYEAPPGALQGALRLRSPENPMALALDDLRGDLSVEQAWVTALVAFADLTCVPQEDRASRRSPTDRTPALSATRRSSARAPRPLRHGSILISSTLEPTNHTASLLSSYVVGHRRRLRPGQRASDEARRGAESVGISLRENETWVKPHLRGAPEDSVLAFRWQAPEQIGALPAMTQT
jgi:hypothetical protein